MPVKIRVKPPPSNLEDDVTEDYITGVYIPLADTDTADIYIPQQADALQTEGFSLITIHCNLSKQQQQQIAAALKPNGKIVWLNPNANTNP